MSKICVETPSHTQKQLEHQRRKKISHIIVRTLKTQNNNNQKKKPLLNAEKENHQVLRQGMPIRMTANLTTGTLKSRLRKQCQTTQTTTSHSYPTKLKQK